MTDDGFYDELSKMDLESGAPVLDVVAAILKDDRESLRVVELGAHMATLVSPSGKVVRVFSCPSSPTSLHELVEQVVSHNPRHGSELILVGGTERETEVIDASVPQLLMHPFVVFHRLTSGQVRTVPEGKGRRSPRFRAIGEVRVLSERERRELMGTVEGHARSMRDDQKERARFFRTMNTRAPLATYGLLGFIALMFVLQNTWGPRVLAAGALWPPLVEEGQWFRTISAGFLHGGLMHVGVNSFVLYLLGGQTERVIGTPRFIVLYTASLLGGSYASLQFLGEGLSVGASGAVWGLLGAQVALAYGKPPVLPGSIAESIKPLAKQNILLNVGISFLPGIDAAAHFGGGLAGAGLLASGVLYQKSQRKGEDGPVSRTKRGAPAWVPAAAVLCVVVLLWGVLSSLIEGQPWTDEGPAQGILLDLDRRR